jgi:NAD(P)-dependent dehydrogenase (short-subunit alcohol dehydrogenase family)
MTKPRLTVLVVGATGSIGRLAVAEAVKNGHAVRALARDPEKGRRLFPDVEVVAADLTRPETLTARMAAASRERSRSTTGASGTYSSRWAPGPSAWTAASLRAATSSWTAASPPPTGTATSRKCARRRRGTWSKAWR